MSGTGDHSHCDLYTRHVAAPIKTLKKRLMVRPDLRVLHLGHHEKPEKRVATLTSYVHGNLSFDGKQHFVL